MEEKSVRIQLLVSHAFCMSNISPTYENEDFYIIRIRQASFLIFKNFDFPALFLTRISLKALLENKNNPTLKVTNTIGFLISLIVVSLQRNLYIKLLLMLPIFRIKVSGIILLAI